MNVEETINRIFDKLEGADISPSSNYSMPEYYMNRAIKGGEREKRTLFGWISMSLGIDEALLNKVFNERYNNIQNESKYMRRKVRVTESDLHRIVRNSVKRVLNEGIEYQGKDADDEIWYYTQKIGDVWQEIYSLTTRMRKGGLSNGGEIAKDIEVLKRYIRMMWAHINELGKTVSNTPTMGQVLDEPTSMVHY